jgi:predicted nucleic acid-binding protein
LETAGDGCISTQVIQEFCNAMRRKTQRTTSEINALLDYFLDLWRCDITPELAREALVVQDEYGISYYDSLIVATAEKLGCNEILTEDLNDGQTYRGMVARNPFKHKK